jgi:RNA polymerase sigma-70 factor (family 1)
LENEAQLCEMAAMGDREAYGKLYTYYYPQLFGSLAIIARSEEDAEEILQNVFVKVWTMRESLALVRSLEDYLFILAKRMLFDHLRHEKLRQKVNAELAGLFGDKESVGEQSPEHALLYKQYQETAQAAIRQLDGFQRDIFLMRTLQERTLDEIAQKMQVSKATVKRHLSSAVKQITHYLKANAAWMRLVIFLSAKIFLKKNG